MMALKMFTRVIFSCLFLALIIWGGASYFMYAGGVWERGKDPSEAAVDMMREQLDLNAGIDFMPGVKIVHWDRTASGWWCQMAAPRTTIRAFLKSCDDVRRAGASRPWSTVIDDPAVANGAFATNGPQWWDGNSAADHTVTTRDGNQIRYVLITDSRGYLWAYGSP